MDEDEEPIVCTSCETTPELHYNPYSDDVYRLRCDCSMTSVDVTSCVENNNLFDTTGKWSNLDYESKMNYGDT